MTVQTNSPTAVPAGTPWANATRAYDDGGTGYASTSTDTAYQQYGTYGFTDPGGTNTIKQVRIRADAWSATGEWINIAFSVDGGSNWTSKGAEHPGTTETTIWWDITSLKTWTWTLLNNTNFRTRVTATKLGGMAEVDLDWIPVEVTYANVVNITKDANARFRCTSSIVPNADTRFKKPSNEITKNADALFVAAGPTTYNIYKNADARLKKLAQELTKLADTRFKRTSNEIAKVSAASFSENIICFSGAIDEVSIYDIVLSQAQIDDLYALYTATEEVYTSADAKFVAGGVATYEITKDANARFKKLATQYTRPSDTRFKCPSNQTNKSSDVRFKHAANQSIKYSDVCFKKLSNQTSKNADTRFKKGGNQATKLSDTRFKKTDNSLYQTCNARLRVTQSSNIMADALFVGGFIWRDNLSLLGEKATASASGSTQASSSLVGERASLGLSGKNDSVSLGGGKT